MDEEERLEDEEFLNRCLEILISHDLIPTEPCILYFGHDLEDLGAKTEDTEDEVKTMWGYICREIEKEKIPRLEDKLLEFLLLCREERKLQDQKN